MITWVLSKPFFILVNSGLVLSTLLLLAVLVYVVSVFFTFSTESMMAWTKSVPRISIT